MKRQIAKPDPHSSGGIIGLAIGIIIDVAVGILQIGVDALQNACKVIDSTIIAPIWLPLCDIVFGNRDIIRLMNILQVYRQTISVPKPDQQIP